jgi:protein-glucosylgalactosylhydroxylysine glucosidase
MAERIDRRALVQRHNPVATSIDRFAPLSVGNGEFAFTADITGLQTFPELYEQGIPLCTQSQWGWHSFPSLPGLSASELKLEQFDTYGRTVGYATRAAGQQELFDWLRENPHRLHLGRVGLRMAGKSGALVSSEAMTAIRQTLDLWTGILSSSFRVDGIPIAVETCADPEEDAVAVVIRSQLISRGRLGVTFDFPYGSPQMNAADWKSPGRHRSLVASRSANRLDLGRQLDGDRYCVGLGWQGGASVKQEDEHRFLLLAARGTGEITFVCRFSPRPDQAPLRSARQVQDRSRSHWQGFWTTGGAVELTGSSDSRAGELERRIVLSQYLTAIQCSGSMPPQETGLTCNSWYGKFHLEMHWWHAAHFALWGRTPLLERSLGYYRRILPSARRKAKDQGYAGARWPKMTAPDGYDSPSSIGPLLIWQQPHPIALAELCYQSHPNRETLDHYSDIVMDSAEFMVSFAAYDARRNRFVLGPPVIPAQENHPARETWNPTFELAYWSHGLEIAQLWRERLGLRPRSEWDRICLRLSELPTRDGVYLAHENCPQTFTERNHDHPSMLAALGPLPGPGVDRGIMRSTLRKVFEVWNWPDTWGWDYPMMAMTAARLGEPALAIESLFIDSPKNKWLPNGHNYQRPNLPLYLPGNGGLLAAVALMAAGWQNGPQTPAPGFPRASWVVRYEGLQPLL